jgi:glycosyltransferase involved in cell wall biosynthesis
MFRRFDENIRTGGCGQVRVLYVVTAFPRRTDDVITPWLSETITRLGAAGVEVEVLAPSYRGLGSQVIDGVRVHRFRYAPAAWETLTHDQTAPDRIRQRPWYLGLVPSYLVAGSAAAVRLARTGRFDVTHAFWPVPHAIPGLAAKYAAGVPLVSTFFGVELTWLRSDLPLLRPALGAIVRRSDRVTAISSYTAELLRELAPGADPVIVPFGATVEVPHPPAALPRPVGDGPYRLLFVGRLVERKGVHVLIDAVQRLASGGRDVLVDVVGDGPARADLESRAAGAGVAARVRFRGLVPDEELASAYRECDAFVLPAVVDAKGDTEGLGVVLLEALAHGRPVIASSAGGIRDIVVDRETGLLVPPADAAALAEAIATYMDEPDLAHDLALAGRAHVERTFSWSGIIDRLDVLYRSVAGRDRPRPGGR